MTIDHRTSNIHRGTPEPGDSGCGLGRAGTPLASRFPTIESLTRAVLHENHAALAEERRRFDERAVFEVVGEITAKHLGLDPRTISREDAFVYDLGAD